MTARFGVLAASVLVLLSAELGAIRPVVGALPLAVVSPARLRISVAPPLGFDTLALRAHSPALLDFRVGWVRMSVLACVPPLPEGQRPPGVHETRDGLKVRWIEARLVPTSVVELQAVRDGTHKELIRPLVRQRGKRLAVLRPCGAPAHLAVALRRQPAWPHPAHAWPELSELAKTRRKLRDSGRRSLFGHAPVYAKVQKNATSPAMEMEHWRQLLIDYLEAA